ncbi:hypothetical protein J5X98_12855 [Leptothermofonsia sichuanensis E412]|uniref:hypothetical protein n=1 Tax=Leptothermofonsia sichuanensis TaxID=2917832 RepID=UPI001CA719D5|nr:hypothetical protein [Leptothermofonsia sichuanensis]QZZ23138.1 hypothetical protein J5X98_12855 [Leptothermofonsia sichuanensis E412]
MQGNRYEVGDRTDLSRTATQNCEIGEYSIFGGVDFTLVVRQEAPVSTCHLPIILSTLSTGPGTLEAGASMRYYEPGA